MKGVKDGMYNGNDPRRNSSGYVDMTAYEAINKIDREADAEARVKKLLERSFIAAIWPVFILRAA